jgi:hypothetical protein
MKDPIWKIVGGYILIIILLLFSTAAYSQVVVTEFNAGWNKENTTDWLDSLENCYVTKVEMDNKGKMQLQKTHQVTIVPTLIIFKDGKEIKRFLADISFTLKATREEVQLFINEVVEN